MKSLTITIFTFFQLIFCGYAEESTPKYFEKPIDFVIDSRSFDETFDRSDFSVIKAYNVFQSSMTGWGRQDIFYGRKIIIKIRDYYQSKIFKINGQLVSWNQDDGIRIKFIGDEDQFDIVEIFIPAFKYNQRLELVFLEDYKTQTPNMNSPEGMTANQYKLTLLFK